MADTKISNFTAGTPDSNDEFVYSDSVPTTYNTEFSVARNAILDPSAKGVLFGASAADAVAEIGTATANGQKLISNTAQTAGIGFIDDDFVKNYTIGDAGTTAITKTGLYPPFAMGFDGTFERCELYTGTIAGNGTIDIYKGNYATPPVGTAQSIIGTATKPSVAGGTTYQSTALTWGTTTFSKYDVFAPFLGAAVGTIAYMTIVLYGKKTAVS